MAEIAEMLLVIITLTLGVITAQVITTLFSLAALAGRVTGWQYAAGVGYLGSLLTMIGLVRLASQQGGHFLAYAVVYAWLIPTTVAIIRGLKRRRSPLPSKAIGADEFDQALAMLAGSIVTSLLLAPPLVRRANDLNGVWWIPILAMIALAVPISGLLAGLTIWRAVKRRL